MAVPRIFYNFTGEVKLPTKNPWCKTETVTTPTSVFDKKSVNIGIKSGGNCVFITCQGTKNKTIRTMDNDNKQIEIAWEDRLDPDVIKSVASYRKWTIDLDGEQKSFITAWDFIEVLEDVLPTVTERVNVRGDFTIRPGKTRNYESFNLQHISLAKAEEKNHHKMNVLLHWRKGDIDKASDGKWYIPSYVEMYVSKDEGSKFFPMQVVLNTSVFDLTKEKHKAQLDIRTKCLEPKTSKWISLPWEVNVLSGAEEVQFDETMLTPLQKALIDSGDAVLSDFAPRGQIYGASVKEYRLGKPLVRDDYAEGPIEAPMTASEFESKIYQPIVEEKLDDIMKSNDKTNESDSEDDLDLF